jgi:histidinol phosphatase-like PHP family hydrolase
MAKRILKALENEYLDILGHPTERLIGKRSSYEADFFKMSSTFKSECITLNYINKS